MSFFKRTSRLPFFQKKLFNMANQTTAQKPPERQTDQNQHILTSTPFQTLKELPTSFWQSQCVLHKHEILICGGRYQRACYSYHTLKNEYKFICEYPSDVTLMGHCVVKLVDNNNKDINEITLLSFGGIYSEKHTLMMKYVSVWSNKSNKSNELNNCNQWIPFTDNHNHPIIIGRDYDNYGGVRAIIGGSNNHLTRNDKNNKQNYQMLLFSFNIGLSIEYDEDNNTFRFHPLTVCKDIAPFYQYACVCINDIILFFGGYGYKNGDYTFSKSVYKYSIQTKKWMSFQNTLPSPLCHCVAILSENDNHVHIIGGRENIILSTHMKTKVRIWDISQLSKNEIKFIIQYWIRNLMIKLGWIDDFDQIIFKYSKK
ncbi:hypothetical protein RFI_02809 [Reticulomyxa filosa]|uniref:Kelch motif family protein n=1 Tax=Reticulomyxa filosa TaxID=46433 RepID=X6P6W4_RETFI|nr:hypothetical protein RFI_02809 [Reticulomyxa filosa]|eukprot:ETO34285.1 hypothetical protein RFI_02809 [Reticulomyxa filosa]